MLVMAKISRKYYKYGLYGLVVLVVLGFAWREVLVYRQKAEFGKAEVQIDQLAVDIEKLVGKPDDIKKEKSCGYASQKFSRGARSCTIAIHLLYTEKNHLAANEIVNLVSSKGEEIIDSLNKKATTLFLPYNEIRGDQIFYQNVAGLSNLDCNIEYIYPVMVRVDQPFKPITKENLELRLSCGDFALSEFYPVKN